MKTLARFLSIAVALGTAGLITGCVNTARSRVVRVTPMSFQIKVVDSSSSRMLPPEELNILKANLVRYLADQGELVQGNRYYVQVTFAPDKAGEPGEWLLVELLSPLDEPSTTVASYQGSSPYFYPDYLRPGYSTYYSSYQDSFDYSYGGSYLPPPVTPPRDYRPHDRNRDGDRDGRPRDRTGRWDNRPGDRDDHRPGTYTGNDGRGGDRDHRPRSGDYTPRSDDSGRGRGRDSDHSGPTTARLSDNSSRNSGGNSGGGGSSSPPPASSYSPPPEPVRSESSNSGIQRDSAQREEN